jgi:hypothetical protein
MRKQNRCLVCEGPTHPLATLCRRCKKVVDRVDIRRNPNKPARVAALQRAWDGTSFRCYYSGARLEEADHHSPRYLTFDHRTPRQEDDVVVAAACLNDMKSDLSEEEFRSVVLALAVRFQGGAFDERVLDLAHWKR